MFNRTYQIRARRQKLQGQQLDITFPKRGRPTRIRALERCGQMRLELSAPHTVGTRKTGEFGTSAEDAVENIDQALQMCFPVGPLSEAELLEEFNRLFPLSESNA